jgi:cyclopropane fatty-acyl-phospholipid synthase-like methyltransferase
VTNTNILQIGVGKGEELLRLKKEIPAKLVGVAVNDLELAVCAQRDELRGVSIIKTNLNDID